MAEIYSLGHYSFVDDAILYLKINLEVIILHADNYIKLINRLTIYTYIYILILCH